ncbi:MAG TPA: Wzz/FepE/Etk N-terminal domain-containing protein [Solirubrobacteraceae bacterium]|jgi:Mrp family chromosome partitioning ATPase|nr:Wzz/FepE/Etk N-terminal domain-containing protein [Solirubrobacteraceae bacterium]
MNETADFATLVAPLWLRKWLILAVAVIVAAGTYIYYHRQASVYSASTQLDLGGGLEAQQLAGGAQNRAPLNARAMADAAALINSSEVTEAVQARLRREGISPNKLGKVRAKAALESYILTIAAEAHGAKQAARLANDYALAYIEGQRARYQGEVRAAIANTRHQLRRIEAAQASAAGRSTGGRGASAHGSNVSGSAVIQEASLASKVNQLEADLAVQGVQQVTPAKPRNAQLIAPKPTQNAVFGFLLALLLACVAVLAVARLDRRVRSLDGLESLLGARVLSALPREPSPIDYREGSPKPADSLIEPLRRLHTAIGLADMRDPAARSAGRSILVLSPDSGDGKSTLVAELALTQREFGARVALIEADLRRPSQASLLSVSDSVGLAEVLAGDVPLNQALQGVAGSSPQPAPLAPAGGLGERLGAGLGAGSLATAAPVRTSGSLDVLVGGRPVASPPAMLASAAMRDLLRNAASEYDYVLIDAPPPLQVSDVMPLLHLVDGIVIVCRVGHTHERAAAHLIRLISDSSTAPVLGVIANGVPRSEIKRGGYASSYGDRSFPRAG